jgi:TM2 domain-containing membrane protein YozV
MPCVNHPEAAVQSFCQNCGKALCSACVRTTPSGQVLCEQCFATAAVNPGADPSAAYWQAAAHGYAVPPPGSPNPAVAAVLGLIPGVGAMYNGQLFKGLIHVVIFAVLVSLTDSYGVFGLFIAAWVLYQSFEAFHTAKARRDGQPVPDPFGLNELGNWLNLGGAGRFRGQGQVPPAGVPGQAPNPQAGEPVYPPNYQPGVAPGWGAGYPPAGVPPQGYQAGEYPPYTEPFVGVNPSDYPPGYVPPGYIPPIAPVSPLGWRRKEPIWAIVLILLGVLFLLNSLHIFAHLLHFAWPVVLIGLGVFLIVRRVGDGRGGSK